MYELLHSITAVFFSIVFVMIFILIWTTDISIQFSSKKWKIAGSILLSLFFIIFFTILYPNFVIHFFYSILYHNQLLIFKSDTTPLLLFGFFAGIFSLIPISAWFGLSEKKYLSYRFNKLYTFLILFLFFFLPYYLTLNGYTLFNKDHFLKRNHLDLFPRTYEYTQNLKFQFSSESRTSSSKGSTTTYRVLLFKMEVDGVEELIFERSQMEKKLLSNTIQIVQLLKEKNLSVEIPFVLIGFSKIRSQLEPYQFKLDLNEIFKK